MNQISNDQEFMNFYLIQPVLVCLMFSVLNLSKITFLLSGLEFLKKDQNLSQEIGMNEKNF